MSPAYKAKKIFFTENKLFKKKGLNKNATAIKKYPTTSIRKHANELKAYDKTVGTAFKQDLSPSLNPLDYAICGVLENKTNATSNPNIDSLKTVIEEEWNKISEEFILEACESFQRFVDTIIEKMVAILCKFTVFCLSSYFIVYLVKLKLIFFYYSIPPPYPVLDYGTKYNPAGSQPGLNGPTYGTPLP